MEKIITKLKDDAKKVLASHAKTVEGVLTCKTIVLDAR